MDTRPFSRVLEQEYLNFAEAKLNDSLHHYYAVRGILFAVSAAPEIPMPNTWLPWVFKQAPASFEDDTANDLISYLLSIFQHQAAKTRVEDFDLPEACQFNEILQQSTNLCHWCYGWLIGHMQQEAIWTKAFDKLAEQKPEDANKIEIWLADILTTLTTFAEYLDNGEVKEGFDYQAQSLRIPQLAKQYVDCANLLLEFVPNQFESFHQPVKREGVKIGRNDPCSCGSGKKYKKCCG